MANEIPIVGLLLKDGKILKSDDKGVLRYDDIPIAYTHLDTTNFNKNLSDTENTIQKAFDKLDDLEASGGGGGNSTLKSEYHIFTGDGSTTEFDCGEKVDNAVVTVSGATYNTNQFSVESDTIIKFNTAPKNDAEIAINRFYTEGEGELDSDYHIFTGDGSTVEFDCGEDVSNAIVVVSGATYNTNQFEVKDTNIIKFNNAPSNDAEISIYVMKIV